MKSNKLTGWKSVYSFTFIETLKSKSYQSMTLIFCLLALLALPVSGFFTASGQRQTKRISLETIYFANETSFSIDSFQNVLKEDSKYEAITIKPVDSYEQFLQETTLKKEELLVRLSKVDSSYLFHYDVAEESGLSKSELNTLDTDLQKAFTQIRLNYFGATSQQLDAFHTETTTSTITAPNPEEKNADNSLSMSEYYIMLTFLVLIVIIMSLAGEAIASSIVTEKANRVIELLMISVHPMALIIGKAFAVLTSTLLQVLLILVCFGLSNVITGLLGFDSALVLSGLGLDFSLFSSQTLLLLPLALISFLLGLAFFSFMAGLAGATVSRVEELAESMVLYQVVLIIGAYLCIAYSMALMMGGTSSFTTFVTLFPLSSPFVIPSSLLVGRLSLLPALLGIVLQVVALILLILFVSKVYETMLMYQGNRLKLKDIIHMAKSTKKEGTSHEA